MILTAAAGAVGGTSAWWRWGGPELAALAILTGVLLVLALAVPRAYAPVFAALDGMVRAALQGLTWVVLGLGFLLVFVPGRALLAWRRRDPLARRPDPAATTYWNDVPTQRPDPERRFRTQY